MYAVESSPGSRTASSAARMWFEVASAAVYIAIVRIPSSLL